MVKNDFLHTMFYKSTDVFLADLLTFTCREQIIVIISTDNINQGRICIEVDAKLAFFPQHILDSFHICGMISRRLGQIELQRNLDISKLMGILKWFDIRNIRQRKRTRLMT